MNFSLLYLEVYLLPPEPFIFGLWHLGLCLRLNLWHGLAGSSLVGFSGLSLFLCSLDGVITLLLTDLWLLLLLGQKLSERKTSNGFWCLDVTSDTSLEGSFLTDT